MNKDYYVGLDIGTNSVGWAVTDKEYNLCSFRGKDMWGIRLFEDAQTAVDRRTKRANRRRLQRRKERIRLLQELFATEMAKVDPDFFIRLNESSKHVEDKTICVKNPLFIDEGYSEAQYYEDYPTIFHLRKDLIENSQEHDVRLVYLALHNLIKHRGHFLIDGSLSAAKDFGNVYETMTEAINANTLVNVYTSKDNVSKIAEILSQRDMPKSRKATQIKTLFEVSFDETVDADDKMKRASADAISKLIVGNKGDIEKAFCISLEGMEKTSIELSSAAYEEEIRDEIETISPEVVIALDAIKAVYDWSVLVDVLKGELYISKAKVKVFEKHKSDLERLKGFIKEYSGKDNYKKIFLSEKEKVSYSSYVGSTIRNGKKYTIKECKAEDFFKMLKKTLEESSCDKESPDYLYLYEGISNQTLLPKLRTTDNSVVPKQVNEEELNAIINNASKYLDFLNEVDAQGISTTDKIRAIFNYKIPYYVGPLSDKNQDKKGNYWMVRKPGKEGPILPWNFSDVVDEDASNEAFIRRMTNKCTYLLNEDVVAKNSLCYSKYSVLNELNNLKIRGKKISVDLKQELYKELFEKHTRITGKKLLDYLKTHDPTLKKEDLSGFDIDFKSSLTSYLDFKNKVFGEKINDARTCEIIESCINYITIYGNDKKMLRRVIENNFGDELTQEEIKNICKLNYSGWGNFSRRFLCEIEGTNKLDGQIYPILTALWETNNNLMQLLSKDFTFNEKIKSINAKACGEISKVTYENVVEGLYISPANKRAVWQTIQIVEEIKKVMGCEPKRIFVEMARGPEEKQKNKRTVSRKQKLIDLYSACDKDIREEWVTRINKHEDRDFNSMKLYLYYSQMGRCAYSGEAIDLDALMSNNSKWDRDHIFPQSKIKDDSLDNLVLANKTFNEQKGNSPIPGEWQTKMRPMWEQWLKCGLISKKKFDRLTKLGDFTEDELAGFLSRQLVETRQATKAVKDVFERIYKDSTVVCVKASLASDFRKKPLECLKSRLLNDYHHAKDAYLNIVVGNVYDAKFTSNPVQWMRENRDTNYSLNKVFYYDVYRGNELVWKAPGFVDGKATKNEEGLIATGSIDVVRKTMKQNNILYTEYTYFGKGQLFDETVFSPEDNPRIPLKKGLDVNKYGGYKSAKSSYFVLIEFDDRRGERQRKLETIPIYVSNQTSHDENAVLNYLQNECDYPNVQIIRDKIKKNSLIVSSGFPMRLRGANEQQIILKGNMQLIVDEENQETIRRIEKILDKDNTDAVIPKFDKVEDNMLIKLFDVLVEKAKEGVYKNRPANQGDNIEEKKDVFTQLTTLDKCKVIKNMLTMYSNMATTTMDLSLIELKKDCGSMKINKNTLANKKLVFIDQSVTGLFENRKTY